MNAFLITAYCIISKGLNQYTSNIDITVDIYDTVIDVTLTLAETKPDVILVDWHSINKINDLYMLYLTQYPGLEKSSILDLVSADVIEKRILHQRRTLYYSTQYTNETIFIHHRTKS